MYAVVEEARKNFGKLVLFTDNPNADAFYCSFGFSVETDTEHAILQKASGIAEYWSKKLC